MRSAFCQALVAHASHQRLVFLTGDLGYKALEPLREALGPRFVNAGVAEQNMVSVAAGLAKTGMRPWAYSIAPFIYARPFEQIRNDVCLHDLPVVLVGNGGGYGYGVMGATHHAIEDYGAILCLPHIRAYVPAFRADVAPIIRALMTMHHPAYLRLGLGEDPPGLELPSYAPWRRLLAGHRSTALVVGPLVGGILDACGRLDERQRPNLWALTELPVNEFPEEFISDLAASEQLSVIEEHVAHGGVGAMMARLLSLRGIMPKRFTHHFARGYVSGTYGSQKFHRRESELDPASLLAVLARGGADE